MPKSASGPFLPESMKSLKSSVMVHGQGIIEALLKVYDAKPLVDEILGRK
jgi:hypothetical protein